MEEEHSKLWRLALLVSLVAFAAVAYFRIPPFRSLVDEKCPWIREQLVQRGLKIVDNPAQAYAETDATPTPKPALTLEQVAADQALWPKDVRLKNHVVFPSVFKGKEVGKVTVPAGTPVQLYKIENQKVAVVFKGGGAWVPVDETDLMQRVQTAVR